MREFINQAYAMDGRHGAPAKAANAYKLAGFTAILRRAFETLTKWQERANGRRELLGLNERMLHDIGISRADAEREADKPFWRG